MTIKVIVFSNIFCYNMIVNIEFIYFVAFEVYTQLVGSLGVPLKTIANVLLLLSKYNNNNDDKISLCQK